MVLAFWESIQSYLYFVVHSKLVCPRTYGVCITDAHHPHHHALCVTPVWAQLSVAMATLQIECQKI